MTVGVEHIILIITTIAGVLKAYFEMRKAQAARAEAVAQNDRASEAETLLKTAVEGLEEAKKEDPVGAGRAVARVKRQTEIRGVEAQFHELVQEVTEGSGGVKKITQKLSRDRLLDKLDPK